MFGLLSEEKCNRVSFYLKKKSLFLCIYGHIKKLLYKMSNYSIIK